MRNETTRQRASVVFLAISATIKSPVVSICSVAHSISAEASEILTKVFAPRADFEVPSTRTNTVIAPQPARSEEHTSELQSLMRISYAVFCLKKKKKMIHMN